MMPVVVVVSPSSSSGSAPKTVQGKGDVAGEVLCHVSARVLVHYPRRPVVAIHVSATLCEDLLFSVRHIFVFYSQPCSLARSLALQYSSSGKEEKRGRGWLAVKFERVKQGLVPRGQMSTKKKARH
jgi:hypothetical protein